MKLVLISNPHCRPCGVMKNQILNEQEKLDELGVTFEYVILNDLEDKETFIEKHGITCTPTTWIENSEEKIRLFNGYVDIETLIEILEDEVNDNEI